MIGFTKSVARELASRGITANAVAPGFIETDMTAALGAEASEALKGRIALGRLGKGEDVANAVLFLASDLASYVTGRSSRWMADWRCRLAIEQIIAERTKSI